jgi:putative flippase GtrA
LNAWLRFARFNAVGAAGIGVQLAAIWFLTSIAHVHYLAATSAAVTLAVAHNFVWHWRWTWGDRAGAGRPAVLFLRFAAANGALSLGGNLVVMAALVPRARLGPVLANAIAIGVSGLVNFWIGDTVVFRRPGDQVARAAGAGAEAVRVR